MMQILGLLGMYFDAVVVEVEKYLLFFRLALATLCLTVVPLVLKGRPFFPSYLLKFLFSKKATKIDEIFTVDLTLCTKCQIDGEDFVIFCGLLRKHEL